jgi:hypothetical protein
MPEFHYRGNEITEFSVDITKFQLNDRNKLPHSLQQVFQTLSRETAHRAIPTEGSSRQHKRQFLQNNQKHSNSKESNGKYTEFM